MKILDCKLLSAEEANKVTVELRKSDTNWWLSSPGDGHLIAMTVHGSDGTIEDFFGLGNCVIDEFGVRPALYLDFAISNSFRLAGHNWINVFDNVYLCEDFIGKSIFNHRDEGNKYEGSVVQKYVLSWFRSQGLEFDNEIELDE